MVDVNQKKVPIVTPKQKEEEKLNKQKKYYELIREGMMVLKFIHEDLNRKSNQSLGRAARRRMQKALNKGKFTPEILSYYEILIEEILKYINLKNVELKNKYNPPKTEIKEKVKKDGQKS